MDCSRPLERWFGVHPAEPREEATTGNLEIRNLTNDSADRSSQRDFAPLFRNELVVSLDPTGRADHAGNTIGGTYTPAVANHLQRESIGQLKPNQSPGAASPARSR